MEDHGGVTVDVPQRLTQQPGQLPVPEEEQQKEEQEKEGQEDKTEKQEQEEEEENMRRTIRSLQELHGG